MKTIIALIFTFVFSISNAQNRPKDYSKMNTKELIDELNAKDKKINELDSIISKKVKNNQKSELEKSETLKKQNNDLTDIITESNRVYLYEVFHDRYILNKNYFKEVDFDEKTTSKIKNSIVLVNSILAGKNCSSEDKIIGEKVLKLRDNYLKFIVIDSAYQNAIDEKYDQKKIDTLISKLDALDFDIDSKLSSRKNEYIGLLKNYDKFTCELRQEITKKLKNPNQNNQFVQKAYDDLKKIDKYKSFPYLIKVIDKVKTKYTTYVENDDLPCGDTTELKKIEEKIEIQPSVDPLKQ